MPVSIPEFWKLVAESRLLTGEQCQQLSLNYSQVKGGTADGSAKSLAEWLVSINTLSKYQATVLLNGRAGPFFYSDYKVYDRIDSGRFKGFFRAVHAASNHPVLLQFVTGSAAQDPQQWAYIAAQVQTRLLQPFPHFQRYFEAVDLGAFKFLVAEDLSGESLADFVKRAGRLSPPDACNAIRQAAVALVEIHRWGLAHGDVRPANLWVDGVGNVRLLHDPAFLPAPWNPSAEDKNGTLLARADYAAPEFAHPAKLPDSLTDLYALGCSFYHLLAGQPPFEGGDIAQKFQRHQTAPIQPLAPLGVPEPLGQIVTYLMAKNPAVRFQHAAQVVEQLTSWVEPARRFPQPIAPAQTLPMFEKLLQIRRANPATHHAPSAGHPAPGHAAPGHAAPGHVAAGGPPAGAPITGVPMTGAPLTGAPTAGSPLVGAPLASGPAVSGPPASPPAPPVAPPPTAAAGSAGASKSPGATAGGTAAKTPGIPTPPVTAPPVSSVTPNAAAPGRTPAPPPAPVVNVAAGRTGPLTERSKGGLNQTTIFIAAGGGLLLLAVIIVVMMNRGGGKPDDKGGDATGGTPVAAAGGESDAGNSNKTNGGKTAASGATSAGQGGAGASPKGAGSTKTNDGGTSKTAGGAGGTKTPEKTPGKSAAGGGANTEVTDVAFQQRVVPDDGKKLWSSPTTGRPLEFQYVPPGGQVFLIVRLADLLEAPEGPKVLQALGPNFQQAMKDWEKAAGVNVTDIEQLVLTLHDNGDDYPRASMVVRVKEGMSAEEWLPKWGDPQPVDGGPPGLYRGSAWSYYVPEAGEGRVFVMGAADELKEVAQAKGAPPALRRDIDKLRQVTDDGRHVNLLLAPNFLVSNLFRDGRKYYFGEAKKIREPIDWLLKDELQGVLLSLHCGDQSYLEMRFLSNLSKDKYQLAEEMRNRLETVPDAVFEYIATLGANPYWERVRLQFPNMIRFLHGKIRIGVFDEAAVLNASLPAPAAHNLLFGSEMVLASAAGAMPAAGSVAGGGTGGGGAKPAAPQSIDEIVGGFKTNLMFEAQSLEFALQDVAKDVNESLKGLPFEFKIKILGDDLKLDGITRNQTVRDFNQRGKTVGEVLTAMVMKANPVTTVKDPSEKDQKLLWVIDKDPDDPSKPIVLITTRQMAEQRKYKLPQHFQPK